MRQNLIPLAGLFMLTACGVFAERQGWAFIQAVGGITVEQPIRVDRQWLLPVHANVSGLNAVTVQPTEMNSGLSCYRTHAQVEGRSIFLTLYTGIAHSGDDSTSARCPAAELGQLTPGAYTVFYRGPNEQPIQLREVTVGP